MYIHTYIHIHHTYIHQIIISLVAAGYCGRLLLQFWRDPRKETKNGPHLRGRRGDDLGAGSGWLSAHIDQVILYVAGLFVCMYECTYVYMYICMCKACVLVQYAFLYVWTNTYYDVKMYACSISCMCVCVCTYVCIYVYILCMYLCL